MHVSFSSNQLVSMKMVVTLISPAQIWTQSAAKVCVSSPMRLCFPQLHSEWITRSKSSACSECYNRWASTGRGSRCHMVHRVKPGELCGTIVGLPWHQNTKPEEGGRGEGSELQDWVGTGGGVQLPEGICVSRQWRKSLWGGGGVYYKRRGQSSWIVIRESPVRHKYSCLAWLHQTHLIAALFSLAGLEGAFPIRAQFILFSESFGK